MNMIEKLEKMDKTISVKIHKFDAKILEPLFLLFGLAFSYFFIALIP